MSQLIDLSHPLENGMPGFAFVLPDGRRIEAGISIGAILRHEESQGMYGGKAEFTLTEMSFQTSIGTYLDAPFVRWRHGRDIADLELEQLVLPGIMIDLSGQEPGSEALLPEDIDVAGKAVLVRFGWDRHWGTDLYRTPPFIARRSLQFLIDAGAKLYGVDTANADSSKDMERPAHSWLLDHDVLIVENLRNLAALADRRFRFFAVPVKAVGAASMPLRAFAETLE
ncbi:MAG: cyclase family protein [Rhodospirillaceae bacterium]|nr:cyclase family protein [Rhodospirillaceae bacterium]